MFLVEYHGKGAYEEEAGFVDVKCKKLEMKVSIPVNSGIHDCFWMLFPFYLVQEPATPVRLWLIASHC